MNKYTIINAHNELISEELDKIGTITEQKQKLEALDTCWKLNKILKHFDDLEPYLDKIIRKLEMGSYDIERKDI